MIYTVRAFRNFNSHQIQILNPEELPQPVKAAFLAAVERGEFRLRPGFAQDAADYLFDASEMDEPTTTEAAPSPFARCNECGRVGLMTTLPGRGICDDCA